MRYPFRIWASPDLPDTEVRCQKTLSGTTRLSERLSDHGIDRRSRFNAGIDRSCADEERQQGGVLSWTIRTVVLTVKSFFDRRQLRPCHRRSMGRAARGRAGRPRGVSGYGCLAHRGRHACALSKQRVRESGSRDLPRSAECEKSVGRGLSSREHATLPAQAQRSSRPARFTRLLFSTVLR